jgi:hypothetical protein
LTNDDEREALALARQAGEAVESLIAQLIVAFEEEPLNRRGASA